MLFRLICRWRGHRWMTLAGYPYAVCLRCEHTERRTP